MKSIRQQLTRRLIASLAVLFAIGLVIISVVIWIFLTHAFDTALRARALSVSALSEWENHQVQFDFTAEFLRDYGTRHPHNFFEARDAAGNVLRRSPSLHEASLPSMVAGTPEHPTFANISLPGGRPGRALAFQFQPQPPDNVPSDPEAPMVTLVVASDREDLNETLWGVIGAIAVCGLLLFPAIVIIIPRVLRHGLRPVNDLADRTSAIDANSLGTRLPVDAMPSELTPIAERLNDLLQRLEFSFARERRFSADLAHELRTPLAELRNLAECALKWPDQRDAETDRDTLAIAQQMQRIVEQILLMARGDLDQLAPDLQPVSLAAALEETWEPFAARAAERNLVVNRDFAAVTASVDPGLLRSILRNLFSNAVEYAPAASDLDIRLSSSEFRFLVTVENPAGDLTAADVDQMFDRLWRKEASRTGGHHLGLGLSLARVFAHAMNCTLTARLDQNARIVFSLRGPLATSGK